jgi:hypothetical protein
LLESVTGYSPSLPNGCNQRLATRGLSTPTDFIASPLHCVVRSYWSLRL